MAQFQNILVGIDLTHCRRLEVDALGPITEGLLRRARWLAGHGGGRVTYFSALNEGAQPWHLIDPEQHARLARSVEEAAAEVLRQLVERDRARGVDAHALLAPGKGWDELVHQVLRAHHDVVLVGSSDEGGLRRLLFGGTGLHLLRHCPCPVWVSRPGPDPPHHLLVASDLGPASGEAVRLAVALLGLAEGARLHVLHVVDYPLDHVWSTGLSDGWTDAYRRRVRGDALEALRGQLARAGVSGGDPRVEVHLLDGAGVPDETILEFIEARRIDLVVLGTAARSGLSAVFLGNVAERLLREARCSLLAVKPPDFRPPEAEE